MHDKTRGTVMELWNGKPFYPENPRQDEVDIETIARGLAKTPRFNGQDADPDNIYTVAQHSVLVSRMVPGEFALEALLHDATEAYYGDMIAPLKALCPGYQRLERDLDLVIRGKFGLPHRMSPEVHHADMRMLAAEKEHLLSRNSQVEWIELPPHPLKSLFQWSIRNSRIRFLERFEELTACTWPTFSFAV